MLSSRGGPDAGAGDTALVRACLGQPVTRTPVWFMRQAGRSLPEYRAARGAGSILAAIADAPLAAELTLQPVRRYGVDAAILFSDIVVPAPRRRASASRWSRAAGPWWPRPFRAADDLDRLRPFEPEADAPYVAEAARWSPRSWPGAACALIGFAGAPFTVASYLVEGGPSRTFAKVKALMHGDPDLWDRLMDRLADMAVASLRAQIGAGAQAVQLFDSWAGCALPDRVRALRAAGHPGRARRARRPRRADHPLRGRAPASSSASWHGRSRRGRASTGASRSTRPVAASGRERALQGNLDPAALPGARGRSSRRRPGPSWRGAAAAAARATSSTSATASCPSPTRASWPPSSTWCTQETRGRPDRSGVLVMAHGTPARPGGDRALLHAHPAGPPAEPAQLAELERPLRRHRRRLAAGRPHAGPGGRARAPRSRPTGAGPLRRRLRGQAHRPADRGGGAATSGRRPGAGEGRSASS